MSFIDMGINLEDIKEDQPVPEGEYTLVIEDVKPKSVEGSDVIKGLLVICTIEGHDNAANVLHNISFPMPEDDATKVSNKAKFIKRFTQLFNIPTPQGKLDLAMFAGKRAKAYLTQEEYQGTISNKIKLPSIK